MHEVIQQAQKQVDQAELYWSKERRVDVRYENSSLQQVTMNDLSSVALRVIDAGRLGLTYGTSPDHPELLRDGIAAAALGGEAGFSFSSARSFPTVQCNSEQTAHLSSKDLIALCGEVRRPVQRVRPDIALFIQCTAARTHLTVETTEGTSAQHEGTALALSFYAPIKGAGSGVGKYKAAVSPFATPEALVDEFLEWYGWTEKAYTPKTARLPVILAPEASFLLTLPLCAGLSGDAIVKQTSPIADRVGDQILSEKLTIYDDPLRENDPASRAFDDEGSPCQRRQLVDRGVLKGVLLDLHSAAKLQAVSTGNGFKRALFVSGTEVSPNPWPGHVVIEGGDLPYKQMLRDVDEGILLTGGMGFHSGNYPQGQFAVQALGFYIVRGKVKGRLERTMVSGNVYSDMRNIRALSEERRESAGGFSPYICVDSLQVAGKP